MESRNFATSVRAPTLAGKERGLYRRFGKLVPESLSVPLAAAGMLAFEGKLKKASALGGRLRCLYSEMKKDSQVLQMLKSRSVDACLAPGDKGAHGHYYLRHVPKAPVMVFLHGYGGNLLFNIWAMMKALPDWTLIHPSWGLDWWLAETGNKMIYLQDLAKDYAQHTGEPLRQPWLAGLSDGGMAAFDLASTQPQRKRHTKHPLNGLAGVKAVPQGWGHEQAIHRSAPSLPQARASRQAGSGCARV